MNTKSLRIFVEVANAGSFSAAARNLGLTQPAVSFQIRTLERDYGNTLIDRSTGHSRLTEAGRSFLEYAVSILEMEAQLRGEMEGRRSEVAGALTIAASNIPGEYIMPLILAGYRERYPLTDPCLDITDSERVLERVRAGEVDLGCVGLREEDERLRYGLLCEDRLVFIAPANHPLAGRRSIGPLDLEGIPFIWREEGSGTRSHMVRILADLGLEAAVEGTMQFGSTMAVIQAVAAGDGVSVISLWAADAYIQQGRVAALKVKAKDLRREFHYVLLRRRPLSSAADALVKTLEEKRPELARRLESLSARAS
ncbi:MAG: LysR family transcriptional regulator [Actinobacteria bacterium]|jgi:DNA-binding transcriptional LysR family regulator|nr:MAG: LysR family transcriptional regulator [Actinomycetota bacterium]